MPHPAEYSSIRQRRHRALLRIARPERHRKGLAIARPDAHLVIVLRKLLILADKADINQAGVHRT